MLIRCADISKSYFIDAMEVKVLFNVHFSLEPNSFTAIIGPSGSGKSTLMNIIGCLDTPTGGTYMLDGIDVGSLQMRELAFIRNNKLGFIFQNFNLLSRYNVFHNVELPLIYSGLSREERHELVMDAIGRVGLTERIKHRPSELSGGQKQRVAIARALVNKPSLILADEPTGNLDSKTGKEILVIFKDLIAAGNTIIMVTHDPAVAAMADRRITIADGRIASIDGRHKQRKRIA
ncbi:MAG: ABC transporter ATP-binding protein [Spirochaetes bacterium]|nr:ABC transporter ATP-binding protein [Spirochaetota bacterium]